MKVVICFSLILVGIGIGFLFGRNSSSNFQQVDINATNDANLISAYPWLDQAKVSRISNLEISYSERDPKSFFISHVSEKFPWMIIDYTDGELKYLITDKDNTVIELHVLKQKFQRYELTDYSKNSEGVSFVDSNLDGFADLKVLLEKKNYLP